MQNKPITARHIQERLRVLFGNHKYTLMNSYVFDWESDFFSFTKTGYTYEVEVKVSRSDFFADFEKPKHWFFENSTAGYFQKREEQELTEWGLEATVSYESVIEERNPWLRKYYPYCRVRWYDSRKLFIPNRFYFALPKRLNVAPSEVPAYAGIIWVDEDGNVEIKREAPFLHKRKMLPELTTILLEKFYYLSRNQAFNIRQLTMYHGR